MPATGTAEKRAQLKSHCSLPSATLSLIITPSSIGDLRGINCELGSKDSCNLVWTCHYIGQHKMTTAMCLFLTRSVTAALSDCVLKPKVW